jgi:transcriptional regulator GlxA family with amidase domain
MTMAHTMLHRAAPDATVTSIATLCGFSNLGRFSVRYRQLYGQPPSQTLRQQ